MVWGLIPVDPLSGEDKYYIFSKGSYKVGRKGCDVTISKDKGVSRVHAEIVVDEMVSLDCVKKKTSDISTKVKVRDCSKYGTFISRADGAKEKAHECPGKEMVLKDGDLVSFGSGNAIYRFSFIPFMLYSGASKASRAIAKKVSSIGGYVTDEWNPECTHVIADQCASVNDTLIDAIVSKKPIIQHKWLEVLAESKICIEIPGFSSYVPTLSLEGASVVIGDIKSRENCLKEYLFLLEPANVYKYGSRLSLLLEVGGAVTRTIEAFDSVSQETQDVEGRRRVHVIPSTLQPGRGCLCQIKEMDLARAVISGCLDQSMLISPSVAASSSCSTDETIVADSDAETETATSAEANVKAEENEAVKDKGEAEISSVPPAPVIIVDVSPSDMNERHLKYETKVDSSANDFPHQNLKYETKVDSSANDFPHQKDELPSGFVERHNVAAATIKIEDGPESGNSEILYSKGLIVRSNYSVKLPQATPHDQAVVNFKRFRKTLLESGNSFTNLVPFAKQPYRESDLDEREVKLKEDEKIKRKMEAVAEDLFSNDKVKRRRGSGSIQSFFGRR